MDDRQDFTQGPIFSKLARFMLPTLAALVLQAMYGCVDLLIVGRFGVTADTSGVSTGAGIMNLFTFVTCSLSVGVTVLIGRYLGMREKKRLSPLIGGSIAFFAAASLILTAVLLIFARPVARLMQTPEEAMEQTVQYVRVCGAGFIFIIFYNFISAIFRGLGNSRLPLVFVAIACVVNIVGDLLLVAVLQMHVVGAALATVFAQAISVLLSLLIIRKQELPFTLKRADIRFNPEILSFVRIGSPLALQEVLTNLSFLALCAFVNRLGLEASAGYGIAQRIQSFVMLVPGSLMQCMAPFVAQNAGGCRYDRARKALLCGIALGSAIGLPVGILTFVRGDLLAQLFSTDTAVIARAFEYLRGFAPEAVVTSVLFSYMGYFNGHSRSLFVMVQGLAQSFLVRLPMSYIMSVQPNASLTYIGLAAPTATVFGIILCTVYYIITQKQLNKEYA